MNRRRVRIKYLLGGMIGVTLVAVAVFFGVQLATKTGMFRVPGVAHFDESLLDTEIDELREIFGPEVELTKDVTVYARNALALPELESYEFLVGISVPVTDFYSDETNIEVASADEMFTNCLDCHFSLVPIEELSFGMKLLSINHKYYLDEFDAGAIFRIISFESERYEDEIVPLIGERFAREYPGMGSIMTLAQTGVTAFSRLMNAKMDEVGSGAYFAEGLASFLDDYDYVHTSSEASFVTDASRSGATGTPICSDPRFFDTLTALGINIVELTGNHNLDCGFMAANETIDLYREHEIMTVGGGKDADAASVPLRFAADGSEVTLLAYNLSTGGATLGDYPGANHYYEDIAAAQITEAKARGDLVIVDVQYYECSAYVSDEEDATCDSPYATPGDEVGFFRHLIDLGVDIVVGTSAHQPQSYELYGDGMIYYGLGNLFFDQYRWPGTTRSLILIHYIYDGRLLQTRVQPTQYDASFQPQLLNESKATAFLSRLKESRP